MPAWRAPHRLVLSLGAALLALAAASLLALLLLGHDWHLPVAVLVLGGLLLLALGFALRPRPAGAPVRAPEPTWFSASTDFAGSALAPDTALGAEPATPDLQQGRPMCPRCGLPMVERSGSRQRKPLWVCSDAPRCDTTLEAPAPRA